MLLDHVDDAFGENLEAAAHDGAVVAAHVKDETVAVDGYDIGGAYPIGVDFRTQHFHQSFLARPENRAGVGVRHAERDAGDTLADAGWPSIDLVRIEDRQARRRLRGAIHEIETDRPFRLAQLADEGRLKLPARLLKPAEVGKLHLLEVRFAQEDLVVARDAGEARAARLDHPLQHLVREQEPLVDHDRPAHGEVRLQDGGPERVVERQHGHRAVALGETYGRDDRARVGHEVAVRQHHAPGLSRRAGAEEERREIVPAPARRRLRCASRQFRQRNDGRALE